MNDFRRKVLKVDLTRVHKKTNSIHTYDIYKYIRKNKWFTIGQTITEHQFYTIIRRVNQSIVLDLLNGKSVKLPYNMGVLEIVKYEPALRFDGDKFINKHKVDWDRTLTLWELDEECYKDKVVVRTEHKYMFLIKYNKTTVKYKNLNYFLFFPNRLFKIALKEKIQNDNFDTFLT